MLYDRLNSLGINKIIGIESIIVLVAVFLLSVLATRLILPVLRARKLNQPINMYVLEHASKSGTPTMGGLCFILGSLTAMLIWIALEYSGTLGNYSNFENGALIPIALTFCLAVGNGFIGFFDDYKKLVKKQNEGLSEMQKLLLQIVVAAAYLCMMGMTDNLPTALAIPFTNLSLELSYFAYPLYLLVIVGFVNSTNITDGIDGLASSIGVTVGVALLVTAIATASRFTAISAATLIGALLGFLVFNHYPAKVFMGDTGSLYIGALIMGCAISDGMLLGVIIMSFVFILDMLSSLLQRLYYKLSGGKRLFKKAPVHHHFQLLDWSEVKIVLVFTLVSAIFCALGVIGVLI
ncbi:MAG: phospho-N-acetylmuramoyl-pentapeptide-transferase [Clostridia bacterium]|nr:phospho-N-acetylmuramoyl-pentapeptide-transferase [Clostridia bacterium]